MSTSASAPIPNSSNIYYILSVDGSKLRDISLPTVSHCEVALSSYPLALEWIPAEFQNRLSLSVEEAVLREPTAIVYDRRTKSIVEMIRDILRANERASLGKTSNKNSTIIIVRHMMNFIKEDDVLKFVALNPRLHSTIVAKIHEFLAMKRGLHCTTFCEKRYKGLRRIHLRIMCLLLCFRFIKGFYRFYRFQRFQRFLCVDRRALLLFLFTKSKK